MHCVGDIFFQIETTSLYHNNICLQTVNHYFAEVDKLSESLGKQLWLILQRVMVTIRREPTIIVTVLRIIEREER